LRNYCHHCHFGGQRPLKHGAQPRDFGDAPDSYHTVLANNGARHFIVPGWYLGNGVDPEPDGQPVGQDDVLGTDDEDGVVWPSELVPGVTNNILVWASTNGYLSVWVDLNLDGGWEPLDQVLVNVPVTPGVNSLLFLVPPAIFPTQTWARVRFNATGGLGVTGAASEGEVEDYLVTLNHTDPDWSAERLLPKDNPTNNAVGTVGANMVVTSSNTVYLFYAEKGVTDELKYTYSTNHGDNWTGPFPFDPTAPMPSKSSVPAASVDIHDDIHLTWTSQGLTQALHYARLDTSTHAWTNYQVVWDKPLDKLLHFPEISVDRLDRVHLFWFEGDHTNNNPLVATSIVMYAQMPMGATNFTAPVQLSTNASRQAAFPLANLEGVTGDLIAAAWRYQFAPLDADIHLRVSHDGGLSWGPEMNVTGPLNSHKQWDPLLIVDRNNVFHMIYNEIIPDVGSTIHIGHSDDAGVTWKNLADAAGFIQMTPTGDDHLLSSSAYDFDRDIVWFFWKEREPIENIRGTWVLKHGDYVQTDWEKITSLTTSGTGLKSFAVGPDGLVRTHYQLGLDSPTSQTTFAYRERLRLPPALPPTLVNPRMEAGLFKFDWESEFAVQYTAQYSTNYTTWTDAVPVLVGDGETVTYSLPATGTWRVVRVGAER